MRRLKRTSTHLSKSQNEQILREYIDCLIAMGYTQPWIEKVLRSLVKGYMRVLKQCSKGVTTRYRLGGFKTCVESRNDTGMRRRTGR